MEEYRLLTAGGRELLVRPCVDERPRLNIGIVSTYGNVMESLTIEASDVLGLARGFAKIARRAEELFAAELERKRQECDERCAAALKRNPWQTLPPEELKRRGLV